MGGSNPVRLLRGMLEEGMRIVELRGRWGSRFLILLRVPVPVAVLVLFGPVKI